MPGTGGLTMFSPEGLQRIGIFFIYVAVVLYVLMKIYGSRH